MKAFQIREEESNEGNSPDTSPANNGGGKQDDGTLKTTTVKRG